MFRFKYLDFYFYVCWQTEIKTCLDYVLDIAQDSTSQDSWTFKATEREFNFNEVRPIEIKPRLIKNRKHNFSTKFYFSPNTTKKTFGVSSETLLDIKRKPKLRFIGSRKFCELILWDLKGSIPSNSTSICQIKRSTIKNWWNQVATEDQLLTVIWNLWVGSQSHKRGSLYLANSR